ncbi:MAG: PDDEXK nuclease domain-containing protein [Bifidobacteriaceae bacterium]|jgi:predicted nuclease of restriction endonuclease-like (RecB) superfamily|nr:PDDEXK nuclease domain-containing protein [Bifidobacteriaceae bacterium]
MTDLTPTGAPPADDLFRRVTELIESGRRVAAMQTNAALTMTHWFVGRLVSETILRQERAEYGRQIVASLARQLTWTHIVEILPIRSDDARAFYAQQAVEQHLSVRELRHAISRKAFERREIAGSRIVPGSAVPMDAFKDPYLLDFLGLEEAYEESDLEEAILRELERFLLEFGRGFAFVERQKRMSFDSDDFYLDLLFFSRPLRRLVAVELKLGKFKPAYEGQMRLYLKWLDRYDRMPGEDSPIGLILCTKASREQVELMELDKEGIAVAEYWTDLPPKKELEERLAIILRDAKERLARRRLPADPEAESGIA